MNRTYIISLAVPLLTACLTQNVGAQTTYTYTGTPFGYNGSAYSLTGISGSLTVSSALAPNTTYTNIFHTLGLETIGGSAGGTITGYSFTDGEYVNNIGNYSTTGGTGGVWGNGTGTQTTIFSVTTGPTGNIANWYINVLSSTAQMNTFDVPSSGALFNLYGGPNIVDQVTADPSQAYDAYTTPYGAATPGTWTVSSVPEPSTLALTGLIGLSLLGFRRRK